MPCGSGVLALVLGIGLLGLEVERTFEADVFGNVEGCVCMGNCILCKTTMWCHHLVKGCNSISWFEFIYVRANCGDCSGNVITAVGRSLRAANMLVNCMYICDLNIMLQFWNFPIFWVGSRYGDFYKHVTWPWSGDWAVDDVGIEILLDNCFFHVCWCLSLLGSLICQIDHNNG